MSDENKKQVTGLALLREPFSAVQIGKLPKPTRKQTEIVKNNYQAGVRCKECGQRHHPDVIHLDYVGHAAITDRLLNVDPNWKWEPFATDQNGLPLFDAIGGLWINLTILGETKPGYGHPDGKTGGNAIKETIGDALRNAGMRFGMALDLWHKGDLHGDGNIDGDDKTPPKQTDPVTPNPLQDDASKISNSLKSLRDNPDASLSDMLNLQMGDHYKTTMEALKAHPKAIDEMNRRVSETYDLLSKREGDFPVDVKAAE